MFDATWRRSYLIIYVYLHQLRMQKQYETKVATSRSAVDLMKIEPAAHRVDRLVHALCKECMMTFAKPEEKIVVQGYRDTDGMYMISDGFCKVHLEDRSPKTKKLEDIELKILAKTDYFGEVSLIHDGYRTASVTAVNYCTLGKLSLKTIYSISSNFPHFRRALMQQMH